MAVGADYEYPDEWKLVNDDGFVHKRKKRQCTDLISAALPPPPDSALERKLRRARKKRSLLKLRDKYSKEIIQWELLSTTLKGMEHNAQIQQTTPFDEISNSEELSASKSTCTRLVNDLLSQVEAQEAIIGDISNLCDVAEALCNAHHKRLNQQFSDLSIWEPSPDELVAALGET
ncbi:hypothetical protein ACJIZ3_018353 [Penstemon smallii]|uniref:Uncharacterized protein n=1 Tax=Penstemon smallii TaxID=265156 RepID=A0ABD3SY35_9LAMI